MERKLAAILAADVVGYSRLMGADEAGTLERLKSLRKELVQPKITARGGRIVKLMGDGLLAEFPSVVEAVHCAVDIQQSVSARETELPEDQRILLRIGVNLGDIIVEGSDIYGDGVNVAARLEALAEPGGIFISSDAYRQARGKMEAEFEDLGEQDLKNVAEPVRVYRVAGHKSETAGVPPAGEPLALPDKPAFRPSSSSPATPLLPTKARRSTCAGWRKSSACATCSRAAFAGPAIGCASPPS